MSSQLLGYDPKTGPLFPHSSNNSPVHVHSFPPASCINRLQAPPRLGRVALQLSSHHIQHKVYIFSNKPQSIHRVVRRLHWISTERTFRFIAAALINALVAVPNKKTSCRVGRRYGLKGSALPKTGEFYEIGHAGLCLLQYLTNVR